MWISVKQELPPKDKPFLCVVYDEVYSEILVYFAKTDPEDDNHFEGWTWTIANGYSRRVGVGKYYRHQITHWMPLPEVPHEMD